MPLPPALLQRLAKRGIVDKAKAAKIRKVHHHKPAQNEEIIAENYDDDDPSVAGPPAAAVADDGDDEATPQEPYPYDYEPAKKPVENFWSERLKRRIVDATASVGYRGCPNKTNIHHKCTIYCLNTFGDGLAEPGREYTRRQYRLLRRYPLPRDWKEVWDHGCGVHYYWNSSDDTVSWLPPTHPNATVGKAAAVQRRELEALLPPELDEQDEPNATIHIEGMNIELPIPAAALLAEKPTPFTNKATGSSLHVVDDLPPIRAPPPRKPKARDLDKAMIRSRSDHRRKRGANDGALDPMDPASYSNIPRGKWSAGLERENEKTGVDATAAGPLFQMRPYPSPGAILAAQGKQKPTESDDANSDGDN